MPITAHDLRCEHCREPLGIESARPRLTWELSGTRRGERQRAWQIQVARDGAHLLQGSGIWDSGRIAGSQQLAAYAGPRLAAGQEAWWRVRAWDGDDQVGPWSQAARWVAGLQPSDWTGRWIARRSEPDPAPAPLFRRRFQLAQQPQRALLAICGLGYHDIHINGRRLGNRLLEPGYTRYDRRSLYVLHECTDTLRAGENVLGVMLGTGWYNVHTHAVWGFHDAPWRASPRLLVQMLVTMPDGSLQTIVSDEQWRCTDGPIRYDSIYGGETFDARRQVPGWDAPGFDDQAWAAPVMVTAPQGRLSAQLLPPIRACRRLEPLAIREPAPGITVVDFGQAFAGHVQVRLQAPAGTEVQIRYGEQLTPTGRLDTAAIDQHMTKTDPAYRFQTDCYIAAGSGIEVWEPRFTYHGFRWVEISGWPGPIAMGDIAGIEHHTDLEPAGAFSCSNPLLEDIARATDWAFLSNLQSIPTDCPQREKNGWTGDAHLACELALFTYRAAPFYEKWLDDLADEQRESGELPGIVPTAGWGYAWGNGPAWDSAYHRIASLLALHLGDTAMLERHYERLVRYVRYLGTRAKGHILDIGLGDWCTSDAQTPVELTSTAYYHGDVVTVIQAARLLGRTQDVHEFTSLAQDIRLAVITRFRDASGRWANRSQCALSCVLLFRLCDEADRAAVLEDLVRVIHAQDDHINGGILAASFVLRALHEEDRDDLALRLVTQESPPGWGHWIRSGATTLWETWNGEGSRNHIMFGDVLAWMYRAIGGVSPDTELMGYARFRIRPPDCPGLTHGSVRLESVRGRILHAWRRDQSGWQIEVTIPTNSQALVHFPTPDLARITEGGVSLASRGDISVQESSRGRVVVLIGSGSYRFAIS